MATNSTRIGIDVGGTFTDATLIDGTTGRVYSAKAFTTPRDRSLGVIDAIRAVIAEAGIDPASVGEVVHGSTTGTNALIERTGAKTGLLVTAGFRDVLEIGRVMRPMEGVYDMSVDRPPPLVPRHLCLEVRERVGPHGEVIVELDEFIGRAGLRCFRPARRRNGGDLLSLLVPQSRARAARRRNRRAANCPGLP